METLIKSIVLSLLLLTVCCSQKQFTDNTGGAQNCHQTISLVTDTSNVTVSVPVCEINHKELRRNLGIFLNHFANECSLINKMYGIIAVNVNICDECHDDYCSFNLRPYIEIRSFSDVKGAYIEGDTLVYFTGDRVDAVMKLVDPPRRIILEEHLFDKSLYLADVFRYVTFNVKFIEDTKQIAIVDNDGRLEQLQDEETK